MKNLKIWLNCPVFNNEGLFHKLLKREFIEKLTAKACWKFEFSMFSVEGGKRLVRKRDKTHERIFVHLNTYVFAFLLGMYCYLPMKILAGIHLTSCTKVIVHILLGG
ncbi:MAG: hypothetical protein HRT53_00025 [Colwellia sp.]|nr:hypothetical protein [Colwellia sp.]